MKRLASWSWLPWRTVGWILFCAAASVLFNIYGSLSPRIRNRSRRRRSPYTPTKGEWLCVVLNSRQALINSERVSDAVATHYLYDRSEPDTVRTEVVPVEGASEEQLQRRAAQAKNEVTEAARVHEWQNWVKVEIQ